MKMMGSPFGELSKFGRWISLANALNPVYHHLANFKIVGATSRSLHRVQENFLPLIGHFVWQSWGYSPDILSLRPSFYTENGQ